MRMGVWLALAVPLVCAFLILFFRLRRGPARMAAKGAATAVCLGTALIGLARGGSLPSAWLIAAAVAVFVASDVLLEKWFVPGVAAFSLGHCLLIAWILRQGLFTPWSVPLAVFLWLAAYMGFRGRLAGLGKRKNLFLLYPAFLMAMTALALALPLLGGGAYGCFALGAALFAISDMMVAADVLGGVSQALRAATMVVYEAAVLLMALTCWM